MSASPAPVSASASASASESARRNKTSIVRTRTGCQNCRNRRRKCDEARPECLGCTKRGIKCSGYERTIAFKDVSDQAAEASRKFEEARWAALRAEGDRAPKRPRVSRDSSSGTASERSPVASAVAVAVAMASPALTEDASARERSMALSDLLCHQPPTPQAPPQHPQYAQHAQHPQHPQHSHHSHHSHHARASSSGSWQPAVNAQVYAHSNFQSPVDPALYRPTPSYNSPASLDYDDHVHARSPQAAGLATFQQSLRLPTPIAELPLANGAHAALAADEAALIAHFKTEVIPKLPVPMTFDQSYMENSCFRNAILALSSVSRSSTSVCAPAGSPIPIPTNQLRRSAVGREHYLAAVSELYRALDSSDPATTKHHAAAALMLAYYEIETGSCFGSFRHAKGLEALLSRLDLSGPEALLDSSTQPADARTPIPHQIFKAWRMLRYDVRFISAPYRHTPLRPDAYDRFAAYDPQLAIRDAYTLAWNLCGRMLQDASVPRDPAKGSRSKQFALWVRDAAGRMCDRRNVEREDYHAEDLGDAEVVRRCEGLTRALDAWHAMLAAGDKPSPQVGTGSPFLTGRSFDPILIMGFAGGYWKAFEYGMYLTARLMISYLVSVYGPVVPGGPAATTAETAAWSTLLLGVVCGMQQRQMSFSYVTTVQHVNLAALLCEGTTAINATLDGVLPYILSNGLPRADLPDWLYLQKGLEICRRERLKGKAIRGNYLTLDEDYEKGHFTTSCSFVVFGDYNGKGHFRGLYSFEGDYVDCL